MRVVRRKFDKAFGDWVNERRLSRGMTQLEYAAHLGVSGSYLSQIERGVVPAADRVAQIAQTAGEDPREWLEAAGYDESAVPTGGQAAAALEEGRGELVELPVRASLQGIVLTPVDPENVEHISILWMPGEMKPDYVIRVEDDRHAPLLLPGDYLSVSEGAEAKVGDLVVAVSEGEQVVARYLGVRAGKPRLRDVPKGDWKLVGVVAGVWRPAATVRTFAK